jgi:hypothetical protein
LTQVPYIPSFVKIWVDAQTHRKQGDLSYLQCKESGLKLGFSFEVMVAVIVQNIVLWAGHGDIIQNPKVHHRVHKSPPLVSVLNNMNPLSILIIFFHIRPGLPSGLFPNGYRPRCCMNFSSQAVTLLA